MRQGSFTAAAAAVAVALALSAPAAHAQATGASCAAPEHGGGEWPSMNHDRSNSRFQAAESTIGPREAGSLREAWRFSSQQAGGAGDFTDTPVVVDGCLYTGSNKGWLFALNADTGALVWKTKLPRGGQVMQSVAVSGGMVYAGVTSPPPTQSCGDQCDLQPYVVAVDQATGALRWDSGALDEQVGAQIHASPVVADLSADGVDDPVLFIGISGWGAEADTGGPIRYAFDGSFVILDANSGELLEKTFTVADDDTDEHAGCSIWSTPAIDPARKVGYVGVSNPFKPEAEHEHCNAVIKVGLDRSDPATFGNILASGKGTREEYFSEHIADWPCVSPRLPSPHPSQQVGTCPDMDLAVGASPQLFTDGQGRELVGVGQKSGVYHAFEAGSMQRVWKSVLGIPSLIGGIVGTAAYDGTALYGPHTVPSHVWSIEPSGGAARWVNVHGPVAYANPVTVANGVAYITDQKGFLNGYETASGRQVLATSLVGLDKQAETFQATQGGVAVARNTVYASVGNQGMEDGWIVALRPGAGGGGVPQVPAPELPPLPGASAAIVAPPAAATATGFVPNTVAIPQGASLQFGNLDAQGHNVVADDNTSFQSDTVGFGKTATVQGVEDLGPGTYGFYCSVHPGMRGTLTVVGAGTAKKKGAKR